jgi:glutathione S-transferase
LYAFVAACEFLAIPSKIEFILEHSQEILDAAREQIGKEQKSAWSEEDEKMLADACIMLDWYQGNNWWKAQHIKNWLKALKQRCAWKPSDTDTTSGTSNWPNYLKG